jgi:pyruvate dehydrogenase E2 component (dihydrolipoamide acetyltransferase)
MAEPHATEPQPGGVKGRTDVQELSAAERTVARRTAEARATIPDLELSLEVDMEPALARCAREACTVDGLLLAACARALREVPRANGAYRDGRVETYSRVNLGFVVAGPDGYLIPTVFDADEKTPATLSAEVAEVARGARERTLASPAFSGATFTVWNAGALGLDRAGVIINPPQAGALAAGAVREIPVIRDGQLRPGHTMTLTLACDHRILYGAQAAAFLTAAKRTLEE